jgi:hypothetical protein
MAHFSENGLRIQERINTANTSKESTTAPPVSGMG